MGNELQQSEMFWEVSLPRFLNGAEVEKQEWFKGFLALLPRTDGKRSFLYREVVLLPDGELTFHLTLGGRGELTAAEEAALVVCASAAGSCLTVLHAGRGEPEWRLRWRATHYTREGVRAFSQTERELREALLLSRQMPAERWPRVSLAMVGEGVTCNEGTTWVAVQQQGDLGGLTVFPGWFDARRGWHFDASVTDDYLRSTFEDLVEVFLTPIENPVSPPPDDFSAQMGFLRVAYPQFQFESEVLDAGEERYCITVSFELPEFFGGRTAIAKAATEKFAGWEMSTTTTVMHPCLSFVVMGSHPEAACREARARITDVQRALLNLLPRFEDTDAGQETSLDDYLH